MTHIRVLLLAVIAAAMPAFASSLPGFELEPIASAAGFPSSLVVDSKGTIWFTTTDGWIQKIEAGQAIKVTALPTQSGGNSGLLGMALVSDSTAVVHYTTWSGEFVIDDVIAFVELATGIETPVKSFLANVDFPSQGVSSEHHGGNPIVAPNGDVFVGIGEYGGRLIAQKPEWNGGKIWRVTADGVATQWATGMRNPYDLAWDPELGTIVAADNGPNAGDELHVITEGANCGWPHTFGNEPPRQGMVPPDYVFPSTIAPTGLLRLTGANRTLSRGYLLGAFVTQALYYFPSIDPMIEPVAILFDAGEYLIDVAEGPEGEIYVAMGSFPGITTIARLHVPSRGDCNGDSFVDSRDYIALLREIGEEAQEVSHAHEGQYAGSFGCDVNGDGVIDQSDIPALLSMLKGRRRAVR
jgi:glucose/arabinose dehydrogenase